MTADYASAAGEASGKPVMGQAIPA